MTNPKPLVRLEKSLARVAREQGVDQERLRRWVSFLTLCGALERAIQAGDLAGYYIKGGVAMESRFAERARATKDLDLGMEGTRASRLQSLSEALSASFDQFTFRIKAEARYGTGGYGPRPSGDPIPNTLMADDRSGSRTSQHRPG